MSQYLVVAVAARERVIKEVRDEIERAFKKHGPHRFASGHEGHGVILEELDELWDEIKADRGYAESARKEAIQVAAMAIRYAAELT